MSTPSISHHKLCSLLAMHLAQPKRFVWENIRLGKGQRGIQADVYAMRQSLTHPRPIAYLVRTTERSFVGELNQDKWKRFLDYACAVYFCLPVGILPPHITPRAIGIGSAGLINWNPNIERFERAKVAKPTSCELKPELLLRLLIESVSQQRDVIRVRQYDEYIAHKKIAKQAGANAAKLLADIEQSRAFLRMMKRQENRIHQTWVTNNEIQINRLKLRAERNKIDRAWRELSAALGLPAETSHKDIKRLVQQITNQAHKDEEAREITRRAEHAINELRSLAHTEVFTRVVKDKST